MKNIMVVIERDKKIKELLVIKNINKITIAEVAKLQSIINLRQKYT